MRDAEGTAKWGMYQVSAVKEYFKTWGYGMRPVDRKGNPLTTDDNGQIVDKNGKPAVVDRIEPAFKFFSEDEWEEGISELGHSKMRNLYFGLLAFMGWVIISETVKGTLAEAPKTFKS